MLYFIEIHIQMHVYAGELGVCVKTDFDAMTHVLHIMRCFPGAQFLDLMRKSESTTIRVWIVRGHTLIDTNIRTMHGHAQHTDTYLSIRL